MAEWIDSHCHLDSYHKKGELDAVLERAEQSGVREMVVIGTDLKDWTLNRELARFHKQRIYYTVGLHPCYVSDGWLSSVCQLEAFFKEPNPPVALGEIGLDYFHLPKNADDSFVLKAFQREAFEWQLSLAQKMDCPIVIHSRNAFEDTVAMIDGSGVDWQRVVMHCFSYSAEQLKVLSKRGGRASFTGIVTYKNAPNVQKALIEQGLEKLMIETDCPYLTPEPHRGKANEPAFVADIGRRCADLLGVDIEVFSKKIAENTRHFFEIETIDGSD